MFVCQRMRRGYTREAYDTLYQRVRDIIPHVSVSTDMITGFCGETEEDHAMTMDLMRTAQFDQVGLCGCRPCIGLCFCL